MVSNELSISKDRDDDWSDTIHVAVRAVLISNGPTTFGELASLAEIPERQLRYHLDLNTDQDYLSGHFTGIYGWYFDERQEWPVKLYYLVQPRDREEGNSNA